MIGMEPTLLLLASIVVLALVFDYINGFHDAANAIATVVATRVLSPKHAVMLGAALNLLGAISGTTVAATVGKGLLNTSVITLETLACALLAAIAWNLWTWWKALPSSSSHALIGSLMGAACFWVPASQAGSVVHWDKVLAKVVLPMFASPLIGFALGYGLMVALTWGVYKQPLNRINHWFKPMQIVSASFMAFHHGNNDAQKSMGVIALAIMMYSHQPFVVDWRIVLPCAIAIALGTLSGGWKIIRTIGSKMIRLQPIHGFAAETTASLTIGLASHWGIPLSTTHVISSAIMGVGATRRLSAVKWSLVGSMVTAWFLTIPVTFLLAGGLVWAFRHLKGL